MTNNHHSPSTYKSRSERLVPEETTQISVQLVFPDDSSMSGILQDISSDGMSVLVFCRTGRLVQKQRLRSITLAAGDNEASAGTGQVIRVVRVVHDSITTDLFALGIAFDQPNPSALASFRELLVPQPYVRNELTRAFDGDADCLLKGDECTLEDFYDSDAPDLFDKCTAFQGAVVNLEKRHLFQALYRVTLTSGLDNRISIFNPITRREEEMICFDSNSYLGLHKHPRVIDATKKVLEKVGYGTPSAQLLGGTNRYLRELEETVSAYHEREDAIIFPSGYAANIGTLTALLRSSDIVVRDIFSHASIHDGIGACRTKLSKVYPHNNMVALEKILARQAANPEVRGKLVVTDGVFSMHGVLANLPKLVELKNSYNAKLMIDDAHGAGVIGPRGRGIEDHFNLIGSADILMGTFSKTPGTIGGYVCADKAVIDYLRFFARSAVFTASLPAAICAGVSEAFRVMDEEPEHRERLWENVHRFVHMLRDIGLHVPDPQSAIITIFVGSDKHLWHMSRELFDSGIKCGNVAAPAVPKDQTILRFTVNARHTMQDLERTREVLARVCAQYGIIRDVDPTEHKPAVPSNR